MKFINRDGQNLNYEKEWGRVPDDNEMNKLIIMLAKADIPFDMSIHFGRPQIFYPSYETAVCDVICHWGSYGHERGLLEIMGLVEGGEDEVEGYLTAEEVFNRMARHYYTNK